MWFGAPSLIVIATHGESFDPTFRINSATVSPSSL